MGIRRTEQEKKELYAACVDWIKAGKGGMGEFHRENGLARATIYGICQEFNLPLPTDRNVKASKTAKGNFKKFIPAGTEESSMMTMTMGEITVRVPTGDVTAVRNVIEAMRSLN